MPYPSSPVASALTPFSSLSPLFHRGGGAGGGGRGRGGGAPAAAVHPTVLFAQVLQSNVDIAFYAALMNPPRYD
jgi:hypothetical protein